MPLISLDLINTSGRLRKADPDQVNAIAESMKEVGLINPVTVYNRQIIKDHIFVDGYGLISGLHRIEAAVSLGWTEIEAHILDLPNLKRQLAECDENLCGSKLSPSERALFTRRRKEIYEAIHPETRAHIAGAHGANRAQGNASAESAPAFTTDTAAKTGKSKRAIEIDAKRGKEIDTDVLAEIAGTELDKGYILDEIAATPKEQQPAKVVEIAERRAVKPAPAPLNDLETKEQWKTAFMRVWNRGAREWRDEVLEEIQSPVFDNTGAA